MKKKKKKKARKKAPPAGWGPSPLSPIYRRWRRWRQAAEALLGSLPTAKDGGKEVPTLYGVPLEVEGEAQARGRAAEPGPARFWIWEEGPPAGG